MSIARGAVIHSTHKIPGESSVVGIAPSSPASCVAERRTPMAFPDAPIGSVHLIRFGESPLRSVAIRMRDGWTVFQRLSTLVDSRIEETGYTYVGPPGI